MCLSERASWTSLIVGTLINVFILINYPFSKHQNLWVILLAWQWALFMQLWEAIAWRNQPDQQGSDIDKCNFATRGGFMQTVTKPICLIILLLATSNVNINQKMIAAAIIFAYICWAIWSGPGIPEKQCLTTREGCHHLDQPWWNNMPGGAMPYFLAIFICGALLFRPAKLALIQAVYFLLTLAISTKFYPCGVGSMWCAFVVFAPIYTLFTYNWLM